MMELILTSTILYQFHILLLLHLAIWAPQLELWKSEQVKALSGSASIKRCTTGGKTNLASTNAKQKYTLTLQTEHRTSQRSVYYPLTVCQPFSVCDVCRLWMTSRPCWVKSVAQSRLKRFIIPQFASDDKHTYEWQAHADKQIVTSKKPAWNLAAPRSLIFLLQSERWTVRTCSWTITV